MKTTKKVIIFIIIQTLIVFAENVVSLQRSVIFLSFFWAIDILLLIAYSIMIDIDIKLIKRLKNEKISNNSKET